MACTRYLQRHSEQHDFASAEPSPRRSLLRDGHRVCLQRAMEQRPATHADDGIPQGVLSPLVGQMFFRATLFSAFGASKRWLAQNADGSPRDLTITDYYAAGAMTGFAAAFVEGPIDFYKSQVQVQIIRSRADPKYKRASVLLGLSCCLDSTWQPALRLNQRNCTSLGQAPCAVVLIQYPECVSTTYCNLSRPCHCPA